MKLRRVSKAFEFWENIIYKLSEKYKPEGEQKPVKPTFPRISPVLILAILTSTVILTLPLIEQKRIYVDIGLDNINDVWTEKTNVPLISTWLEPSQNKVGVYTITIEISPINKVLTIENVPSDTYSFDVTNLLKSNVIYQLTVTLERQQSVVDTYVLNISF